MNRTPIIFSQVYSYLISDVGKALIRTLFARGMTTLGSLVLIFTIGRLGGPEDMGLYALAYSILLGVGILARLGMDDALMRYVAQRYSRAQLLRLMKWSFKTSLIISVVASSLLWLFRLNIGNFFGKPELAEILTGMAIAAPPYTIGFLFSGFFKGIRKPATACLLENGSISLMAGLLIVASSTWLHVINISIVGYAYAIAAWLIAIQGSSQLWLWFRHQSGQKDTKNNNTWLTYPQPPISYRQFMDTSISFFITTLSGFMQSVIGIMIFGWFLSSKDLGLFKISQQIAMLIGFILIVINAVFPPRFAALYYQRNLKALNRLARQGALIGFLIAAIPAFIFILDPSWILCFFGSNFKEAGNLLRILAFAQLVNVSTGSVGFLLNMTGHERLLRNITLACNTLGLIGFFFMPQLFGAVGAAFAFSALLIAQNTITMLFVWKRLGIWTLPVFYSSKP